MKNTNTNTTPAFEGTVAQLAGKIEVNGEVLNLQEVQFLTRIGRAAGFAEQIGTAEGTGTRGGKRAVVWRIKPGFRMSLAAAQEVQAGRSKNVSATKGASDANAIPQAGTKAFEDAVNAAVAKLAQSGQIKVPRAPRKQAAKEVAPAKRGPGRPAGSRNKSTAQAATA